MQLKKLCTLMGRRTKCMKFFFRKGFIVSEPTSRFRFPITIAFGVFSRDVSKKYLFAQINKPPLD